MFQVDNYPAYKSLMIWYASALHILWAIMLTINPLAGFATTTLSLTKVFGDHLVPMLVISAAASLYGLYKVKNPLLALVCMLPQQAVWSVAAWGASKAILLGMYGDGTIRSPWFIGADQAPVIGIVIFYTFAIWQAFRGKHE